MAQDKPQKSKPQSGAAAREARLKAALKANLARRKAQARAKAQAQDRARDADDAIHRPDDTGEQA
jgi:hypothetical protein